MHPILFEYGSIRIGSYGLLLSIAFGSAIFVTLRQFKRNNSSIQLAWDIFLLAIIGGLTGSRLLYILENWTIFINSPVRILLSTAGFSVIGGYVLAISLCVIRIKYSGESVRRIADLCSPGLAIGYAVGRLGCIAAGDGCYGLPTHSFFGMTFPHGLVPTLSSVNKTLVELHQKLFPGLSIPKDIAVHPTPFYESFSHFILLLILLLPFWKIGSGRRFAFFLGWFGVSRFLIEFIRLNPIFSLGLTSDQFLSVFILISAISIFYLSPKHQPTKQIS